MTVPDPALGAGTRTRPGGPVTVGGILQSEWTKFFSLRSSPAMLLTGALMLVALAAAYCGAAAGRWDQLTSTERARFNATDWSLGGLAIVPVVLAVLGVLAISGEYGTGAIRSTFVVVPRRLPVLWAKAAVLTVVTFPASALAALSAFGLGQCVLTSKRLDVSITSPGTPRILLGAALYLTLATLFGLGIGMMLRSTAAGITAVTIVLVVLPQLTGFLPGSWGPDVSKYLPSAAGQAVSTLHPAASSLAPWTGLAVLCAYTLAALAVGSLRLRRQDI